MGNTFVTDGTREKIRKIAEMERCSLSEVITRAVDIMHESLIPGADPNAFAIVKDVTEDRIIDVSHRLERNNKMAETKREIRAAWEKVKKSKTKSARFSRIYGD